MRFWTAIALITALSALGLTYEIAAGRVLAPFFGTSLLTWTTVIAVVLAGFAVGSALGGLVAERPRPAALRIVAVALVATAVLMAVSPLVLGLVYGLGARGTGGMALAVTVAFLPAAVLVSLPSPLLAKMAVEARPGREGSSLGAVLAAGSLGAIGGAVLAGFVALPLIGSTATFAGCGAAALACLPALRGSGAPDPARRRALARGGRGGGCPDPGSGLRI
ncbi:fused MFS/spermidine synthase [Jannaschia sp. LMIT008]|uniref:fused MFS/spermidine synthase n=1 Tax=Jannaschia maritima TaxID=3032585 RepID=UPI0028112D4A|nr:fused MFS/spermidine synthase [Jannaschia sp. LMIT008]